MTIRVTEKLLSKQGARIVEPEIDLPAEQGWIQTYDENGDELYMFVLKYDEMKWLIRKLNKCCFLIDKYRKENHGND